MSSVALLFIFVLGAVIVRLYWRMKDAEERLASFAERLNAVETLTRKAPTIAAPINEPVVPPAPVAMSAAPFAVAVPPPLPTTKIPAPPSPTIPAPERPATPIPPSVPPAKPLLPALNLEAFMGVKLFAWLGGLALFLGVVFFIRYSFEHNLITPAMRLALGTITGLGLILGGLLIPQPKFAVTAQTLCATGIVVLYGVTFASYSLYHFVGLPTAFAIMAAITGGAFLLAVKMNAQVVAILGLLGGFLTPLLLSTGEDNAAGLFTYLAVLDLGLIAVVLRQGWPHLVALAAAATALMQWAWIGQFFLPQNVSTGAAIFLGFEALFLFPFWRRNSDETGERWTLMGAGIAAASALLFSASLLRFPMLGEKPWIVLTIALLADFGLVVWPLRRAALQSAPLFGGGAAFLILSIWNVRYLSDALLFWALGFFLVFAVLHTALPIILQRLRPTAARSRWAPIFPVLALVLMLWPAFRDGSSPALWAAVLVVDLAALALAAFTASLLGVVAALVLTLLAVAVWLGQTPIENPGLSGILAIIAGFAALFCGASVFLQRHLAKNGRTAHAAVLENEALQHLPALSAVLPFLLLISVVQRLHPFDPSAIFSVGLLLVLMLLALARWSDARALPPIALGCIVVLEAIWHTQTQPLPASGLALAWYFGLAAIIAAFPFIFEPRDNPRVMPWASAALAPVLHYPLFRDAAAQTWVVFEQTAPGLIPTALAAPALAAVAYLRRAIPIANTARIGVLAWFAGVALFFITLIFPAQFDHEWLTISWALEGAALCWLFRRLPHPGLRFVGVGLLAVVFVRLALNPAVFVYHLRSGLPIWNWYLYTYGLAVAACFAGGWLLAPPRHKIGRINAAALLFTFGTILLFLLLNIEIADFFATGPALTLDFSGNLARDMTYSIAWALFALGLLVAGMRRRLAPVRHAGLGLFVITLVKLFLHDLAQLDQLYRIGAFIAVAVLLIGASFLYQRFLAVDNGAAPREPDEAEPLS